MIANDRACAVAGCSSSYWCEVTAVCELWGDRSVRIYCKITLLDITMPGKFFIDKSVHG